MFLRTNKYRLLAYVEKGVGGAPEALGSGGLYIHTAIFIHFEQCGYYILT